MPKFKEYLNEVSGSENWRTAKTIGEYKGWEIRKKNIGTVAHYMVGDKKEQGQFRASEVFKSGDGEKKAMDWAKEKIDGYIKDK